MIELNINNLTKYYGANKIFENISFEIKTGERIGLIGQNGCGKTTVMKILMEMEDHQGGDISLKKDNKMGYLNQIPVYDDNTTTIDVVRMAFEQVHEIQKQMKEMEHQMSHLWGDLLERAMKKYSRLQEEYERKGGYEVEIKIDKVTTGLLITDSLKNMCFNQLSGGEKTRVILAKILLEEPDILLLDEPTNHLDLVTIEWLEGFLREYKGSALIISHDRYFLDSVVSKIVELEFDHAEVYLGNYSYYVVEKESRFLLKLKNYQNQQKKIDQMEQQIQRFRIWGEMRDSAKMFKHAKELEKRLEKIDPLSRPQLNKRKIRLNQNQVGRSGKIVLTAEAVSKSFGDRTILENVDFTIFYQDSACIIGENGSGKTTLLKMILGELEPDKGAVKLGAQIIVGYLPQQVGYLDEEQTVLEYFAELHNITNGAARSQLAKVLFFNEDVNKKIKFLSGGEKSRLKLCSLTFEGVNFLILDEPTNHLDIDSREVLEETLSEFDGTILFVSHDRYFINKVADKIIAIENNSTQFYAGDYNYYLEESVKEQEKLSQISHPDVKNVQVKSITIEKETSNTKGMSSGKTANVRPSRKLEFIEQDIEKLEEEIKELDELILQYCFESEKLSELFLEKAEVKAKLDDAYAEWEKLQLQQ